MATREVFGDERLNPSSGAILLSVRNVVGDDEGDREFGDMMLGLLSGREQRRMV